MKTEVIRYTCDLCEFSSEKCDNVEEIWTFATIEHEAQGETIVHICPHCVAAIRKADEAGEDNA